MAKLKINQQIVLTNGQKGIVKKLLGSGGQGSVYVIDVNGQEKALKWYNTMPSEKFINNIRKNITNGSPSSIFLWPESLTNVICEFNSMGYVMPLCPEGYYEFSKFRLAKVRFSSFRAILTAAIETCEAFRQLHAHGLSYQDLNDGGFFINPITGDVKICDCDNVFPHGESSGIIGKARYIAPEVVTGKNLPDSYSDRFSMALIIFMYFCIEHPFEGQNVVKHPCLTEDIERKMFGESPCFMFDPENKSNRPVANVHGNAITIWDLLPYRLREIFMQEFGKDKLKSPQRRITELEWKNIFMTVRDSLVCCPKCGDEVFLDQPCMNPKCMAVPYPKGFIRNYSLLHCSDRDIPLVKNMIITLGDSGIDARVYENPKDKDMLLIQNLTPEIWKVRTLSGKIIEVKYRGFIPVMYGLSLTIPHKNHTKTFQII